jgi:hypothetical protein
LNAGRLVAGAWDDWRRNHYRRLVDRARAGLGHDDTAGGQAGNGRRSVNVARDAMRRRGYRCMGRVAGMGRFVRHRC